MSSSNVIELFKNSEQYSLQEQLGLLAEIIQSLIIYGDDYNLIPWIMLRGFNTKIIGRTFETLDQRVLRKK